MLTDKKVLVSVKYFLSVKVLLRGDTKEETLGYYLRTVTMEDVKKVSTGCHFGNV